MPLELLVPQNHPARISAIVDSLDLSKVYDSCKGGGAGCFEPYMMLKILIFGYINNICSGRQLAKVLQENICFMGLASCSHPDLRTISMFRSVRLGEGAFDDIFTQVVPALNEHGLVPLEHQFIDGTKLESKANKYTFVWRGTTEKNQAKLIKKIKIVLNDARELAGKENTQEADDVQELTAEEVKSVCLADRGA